MGNTYICVSLIELYFNTACLLLVMQRSEAMHLVRDAITAGILNDLVC